MDLLSKSCNYSVELWIGCQTFPLIFDLSFCDQFTFYADGQGSESRKPQSNGETGRKGSHGFGHKSQATGSLFLLSIAIFSSKSTSVQVIEGIDFRLLCIN